jgi:asparagine synthase (glutamine-hydrolysing)
MDPDPARIDAVSHRGPDGRGWRVIDTPSGPLALGHRRLAIIDRSDAGLQPFADPTGRWTILLNGEIYNYVELRSTLEAEGCRFRTATDTEVLLQAIIRWGDTALSRLIGMFAFLLWDETKRTLLAARDRFGIKPLYLARGRGWLALGSEIKQLLGFPGVDARPDALRLRDFLATGISDHTDRTMFHGIGQIRGGEQLTALLGGPSPEVEVRRWHEPEVPEPSGLSRADTADRFRSMFDDAVRLHLRSDVRVGSCLSGGLDSSSLVVTASRMLRTEAERAQFVTVSAVYPGTTVNEGAYAAAVTRRTGFRGVEVTPDAHDLLDNLAGIVRAQDEPFGSTSILSQWAVFRAARREGVKVMLDGQGADEMLAGYEWMSGLRMSELVRSGKWMELARFIDSRVTRHPEGGRKRAALKRELLTLARSFVPQGLRRTFRASFDNALEGGWLRDRLAEAPSSGDLAEQRLLLTYATNLPMLLHWEDRNSMIHGIEARVPFLDHRLVDFCLSLRSDKLFDGSVTKAVLRDAMRDRLPPEVSGRRDKLGFATPESAWLRGALRPAVEEGVEEAISRFPDLFEPAATRAFRDSRLAADAPLDFTLWRIASTGLWGREFRIAS